MTVYVDELFAVNLAMDWIILWAAGNLAQQYGKWWRLSLAAILGAFYSVAVLLLHQLWLFSLPVKIGWSFLMLSIAYPVKSLRSYLKLLFYFYLISFILAGASLAVSCLLGTSAVPTWSGAVLVEIDFQLFWLVVGSGIAGLVLYGLRNRLRQDIEKCQQIVTVCMQFEDRSVTLSLLVDSGHCLTDPLSGRSVLVAEQDSVLSLFSDTVQNILKTESMKPEQLVQLSEQPGMAGRWRIIPYQSVGSQGLMAGFRLDTVYLRSGKKEKYLTDVTVALSPQNFSRSQTYQGLLSLDLL